MERSLQHSSTSSSTDSAVIPDKRLCESVTGVVLTEPRPAHLETALRAHPPKVKSSEELEQEELQKIPKFKARPLSKKDGTGAPSQKHKPLILTILKDPGLETAQRSRPTRFKSADELEEEMLAKIPKFKARPLNKKILEAPLLPPLQKTVPQLPEFQTMERSLQHSSTSSSTDSAVIPDKRLCESVTGVVLTEPRPAHLETALRAHPPKVKSSEELEQEELQKIPKFKARPLNKKDGTGAPSQKHKPLILTIPKDPRLETAERSRPTRFKSADELEEEMLAKIPKFKARPLNKKILEAPLLPPLQKTVAQLPEFQTMERSLQHSSTSSSTDSAVIPDKWPCESVIGVVLTEPRPAHLETALHARPPKVKSSEELEQEELQKIPKFKARPLNKKIPAKPIPKECTKPEPFQLESLMRHEEELEQRTEELARVEREEQEMRTFRAQPIISNVPVHVPEMPRKPLTEV